ncbi:MAG: pseudaminic acid cytidylyltransferase [Candidatus Muirbacterium halophilum]|nr:pseudaminic acid cytidylyltransferase [Candidatus Muirbacterium halophilum]MCK9477185.1 pseudaminic acid cytidylyltransferase [Candidatus Muirbacterium halophilum]
MKNLAIIPARAGSKRIPKKNIKHFLGKPIIAYSIENALNSGLFDEVMVSTDSAEVANIAKKYGAKVPFLRSEKTSDDYVGLFEVLAEVITDYKKNNIIFDNFCMILATAPFINKEMIQQTYHKLIEEDYDTVFPVVRFSYPIFRALKIEENKINMIWPDNLKKRSQDLPAAFHDAGLFYWGKVEEVLRKKTLFTDNSFGYEIPEKIAQDIDTEDDWEIAEIKYNILKTQEKKVF